MTWTKDGNLLDTLFATQGFNTIVNAIIAASPTIIDTPNAYDGYSGTYTLSASDFRANGLTSWFGALGYVNYLNSINYAGSNQWYLPTTANTSFGRNTTTNGTAKGDELVELFYRELNGTDGFGNRRAYWSGGYWSGTEYAPDPDHAWNLYTDYGGYQYYHVKNDLFYAWAVSPGQVAAVPEPESVPMLLAGLAVAGVVRRRQSS